MNKVLVFLLAIVLCPCTSLFLPAPAAAQTFSVTFSSDVSAQPLDGRLLLLLSTDPSDEPRNQIDDTPHTQIAFGLNVDGWQPGKPQVVDASVWGYPIRSLKDVPPGEYYVQAVLNKYETFHRSDGKTVKMHMDQGEGQHWNISPGNLYSEPVKMKIAAGRRADSGCADKGDSTDSAGGGHKVHSPHSDSKRGVDKILGPANVSQRSGVGS